MRTLAYILALTILSISACSSRIESKTKSWIFDNENILSHEEEDTLNQIIIKFEKETTNEVVIVTTDNIGDHNKMVFYAVDFGNRLGVGKKNKDNGLVIVVSKQLRETFIATGKSTENILKDEICKNIVDNKMIPEFKNGQFYSGIKKGLEECIRIWNKK